MAHNHVWLGARLGKRMAHKHHPDPSAGILTALDSGKGPKPTSARQWSFRAFSITTRLRLQGELREATFDDVARSCSALNPADSAVRSLCFFGRHDGIDGNSELWDGVLSAWKATGCETYRNSLQVEEPCKMQAQGFFDRRASRSP